MATEQPLRVLVVDDELLGRQRIEDLLGDEPGVEIVGTADSGPAAIEAIRTLRPDLVFLDVQMPGMTGLDVLAEIGPDAMPATIFVTAYDDYALKAFEVAALDYLVKPFDDERFEQAVDRARRMIEMKQVQQTTRRLLRLLGEQEVPRGVAPLAGESSAAPPRPRYLERIAVEMRGQVRVVPVESIDYIEASGPYAEIHAGDRTFVVRERMQTLEERLDPQDFFRIHRSAIVRLDRIESLQRGSGGDYGVRLRGGTELSVSRGRREELEDRLGIVR